MSENAPTSNGRLAAVHDWIVNHDNSWLFVVLYISLAAELHPYPAWNAAVE
jgi:hypothetical protein